MSAPRKKIDRRGKNYEKTAYPSTDAAEVTSVKLFTNLIDEKVVKTHINVRDKIPNTDGYIEPVDLENRSIGKIHVQLKTLSAADVQRGGYSSDVGFLGHCKDSLEPSILVGVDQVGKRAFWVEVTPSMVADLEAKGSLTVKFPPENSISESVQNYYEQWVSILEQRKKILRLFSGLDDDVAKIRFAQEILNETLGGIKLDEDINVGKISEFMDEYNRLMTAEFKAVSQIYYPNARKFGFAYNAYADKQISYSIYEINKDSTDIDIKKIPDASFDDMARKGFSPVAHFGGNPVEDRPKSYAREIVRKDLIHIIDRGGLSFKDETLSVELIFDILDKSYYKFGLEKKDIYTIDEILAGFDEYLPRWIINILNQCNDSQLQGLSNVYRSKQYFDIVSADFMIPRGTVNKVHELTLKQIEDRTPFRLDLPIGHDDYPINLFVSSLERFKGIGQKDIKRLYPKFDYDRNKQSQWIYKWLAPEGLLNKVKLYYDYLPGAFDSIVQDNFPLLKDRLQYASDYNRQIIMVKAHETCNSINDWPSLMIFNLKCLDENHDIKIDVYMEGDQNAPQLDFSQSGHKITIDGKAFQLVSGSNSSADKFFHPLPLYNSILESLKEKFEAMFEDWSN